MGKIIAGMASAHAIALNDPAEWDSGREWARGRYKSRYGVESTVHPKVAEETLEANQVRYQRIKEGFNLLRQKLREKRPDALILVGNDQNENFKEDNVPQIAIYLGKEFYTTGQRREGSRQRGASYRCHIELERDLLHGLVDREFDVSFCKSFLQDELLSHAHGPILSRFVPEADIPVVLLFVNTIYVPGISPSRCYRLGRAIKEIVERRPSGERVAVFASGGFSHFTMSFPYHANKGPHSFGSISEEFDRGAVEFISHGEGERLSGLTSQDLIDNGDHEMRSWIVLLGAMGKRSPQLLVYEPFYRAMMGMAVGYWETEDLGP